MKSYKDLDIYCLSYDLAIRVHKISLMLPKYELFEEGSQMRRSSKGITSCIAEGYGRRKYKPELIKYLVYAYASCNETIVHLQFIRDTYNDIASEEIQEMLQVYDNLGGKINKFIRYVEEEWR